MTMYYCIYDGYDHRESSRIGRQHDGLRVKDEYDEWLTPYKLAVGVSLALGHPEARNRASTDQVIGFWDAENFNQQFDKSPISQLRRWSELNLIGKDRFHGHQWWEFLANSRESRGQPVSPDSFSAIIHRYASNYDQIAGGIYP